MKMSGRRRHVLRGVFWAGVVLALAAGVALAVLDHLLVASAVLVGGAFLLGALAWLTDPPPSGRMHPERLWNISTIELIASGPIALAGGVLLLVGPATLGSMLLMGGIAMALAGLL